MKLEHFKTKYTEYYKDSEGHLQGKLKRWRDSGQLCEHSFWKNGKLEGEYKWWHGNGKLWEHCFYKNGKREGEYKQWFMNGKLAKLAEHSFFKSGIKLTEKELLKLKIKKILE